MKNPLKFIQEVKQEAFKVSWPTSKETLQGAGSMARLCKINDHSVSKTSKGSQIITT